LNKIKNYFRRSYLDYAETNIDDINDGSKILRTLEKQIFRFKKSISNKWASVTAELKKDVKLREMCSEIRPGEIEQIFSSNFRGLEIESKISGSRLGQFKFSNSKNGFKIGWEGRDIDDGIFLARKMSKTDNITDVLVNESNISSILQQGDDQFIIKFKNSEKLMNIALEKEPGVWNSGAYKIRVSDIDKGIKNYQLKWLEPSALGSELQYGKSEYIAIRSFKNTGKEMIVINPTRGPPNGTKPFEIDYGHYKIKGRLDPATEEIFIEQGSIPKNLRETPDELLQIVKNNKTNLLGNDPILTHLRNKDYGQAAKEIVQNPQLVKSGFNGLLNDELPRIEKLMYELKYREAGDHIDDLIEIYGPRPELKIRKGLIELKRNRCIEAKKQFHDILTDGKITNQERYLQEMNSQLEGSSAKFCFDKNNNESYLSQLVKETEIKNIDQNSSLAIYIQDDPALTNLDWSPATRTRSLNQAIRNRRVVKLVKTDIDKVNSDILIPRESINLPDITSKGNLPLPKSNTYRFLQRFPGDNSDDNDEKKGYREIYLILAD
jgi:hypothetical protein